LRADDAIYLQTLPLLKTAYRTAGLRADDPIYGELESHDLVKRLLNPLDVITAVAIDFALKFGFELEGFDLKVEWGHF
jgi:hypothetical protein